MVYGFFSCVCYLSHLFKQYTKLIALLCSRSHCTCIVELIRLSAELAAPCLARRGLQRPLTVPLQLINQPSLQGLLTLYQPARLVVRQQSDLEKIMEQDDSMQSAPSAVVHWSGALNLVFKIWKSPVTLSKEAVNCQNTGFSSFG